MNNNSKPTDLIRQMTTEVRRIKSNAEWRIEYMTLLMANYDDDTETSTVKLGNHSTENES